MTLGRTLRSTVFDLLAVLLLGAAVNSAVLYWSVPLGIVQNPGSYFSNERGDTLILLEGWKSLGVPVERIGLRDRYVRHANMNIHTAIIRCDGLPPDDRELAAWIEQRGCTIRRTWRETDAALPDVQFVNVIFENEAGLERPEIPLTDLGYKRATLIVWYHFPACAIVPHQRELVAIHAGTLLAVMLLVALARIILNGCWRHKRPRPLLGINRRALIVGMVSGLILGALYWLHEQVVVRWFPVTYAAGTVWQSLDVAADKTILALLVVFLIPLAQELYFRGEILGPWAADNRAVTGTILSALIFALLSLDWPHVPLAIAAGVSLGAIYCRTRSLFATFIANTILHAVMVGAIVGWIPNLAHPVHQISGTWSHPSHNKGKPMRLARSGHIRDGSVLSRTDLGVIVESDLQIPNSFHFVAGDQIELKWDLVQIGPNRTQYGFVYIRYRVAVTDEELILTRIESRLEPENVIWIFFADTWIFGTSGAELRFRRVP